jgi:hypothetical protein
MLTVQDFPSALSVPTTLAARPLSSRSLLLLTHVFNRGRPVLFEVGSEREQAGAKNKKENGP